MNIPNVIRTARTNGEKPPADPQGQWNLIAVLMGTAAPVVVWALVADEAPAVTLSPTDAEIERRAELLRESCTNTIVRDPTILDFGAIQWGKCYIVDVRKDDRVWAPATDEAFNAELRRIAIRQLLAGRGGGVGWA